MGFASQETGISFVLHKGKPVERRGRKVTGLMECLFRGRRDRQSNETGITCIAPSAAHSASPRLQRSQTCRRVQLQTGRGYERDQRRGYKNHLETRRERPIMELTAVESCVPVSVSTAIIRSQCSRFPRGGRQRLLFACVQKFCRATVP